MSALEAWHVEVQASFRPISYIAPLPDKAREGFAKSRTSMKVRSPELVETAAAAWVEKKFRSKSKRAARETAWPGMEWKYILVHAAGRYPAKAETNVRKRGKVLPLIPVHLETGQTQ